MKKVKKKLFGVFSHAENYYGAENYREIFKLYPVGMLGIYHFRKYNLEFIVKKQFGGVVLLYDYH